MNVYPYSDFHELNADWLLDKVKAHGTELEDHTTELTALNDAVQNLEAGKVDKEPGKGLSTNDFTDADKTKLDGIESGAERNVGCYGSVSAIRHSPDPSIGWNTVIPGDEFTIVEGDGIKIGFSPDDYMEISAALSSAVDSSSETTAATSNAVKTVNDALAGKVDAVAGKGLSSNDYTDADAAKLSGIQAGAQVNPTISYDRDDATVGTIAAGGTAWCDITIPAGRTLVAITGFYINGTGATSCHLYALFPDENDRSHLQGAIKNMGTSQTTGIKLTFVYSYI